VLCVVGTARSNKGTADSIASCHEIAPYASNVHIVASFPGLDSLCQGECQLSFRDATPMSPE